MMMLVLVGLGSWPCPRSKVSLVARPWRQATYHRPRGGEEGGGADRHKQVISKMLRATECGVRLCRYVATGQNSSG